jgi:hypothetical protein
VNRLIWAVLGTGSIVLPALGYWLRPRCPHCGEKPRSVNAHIRDEHAEVPIP